MHIRMCPFVVVLEGDQMVGLGGEPLGFHTGLWFTPRKNWKEPVSDKPEDLFGTFHFPVGFRRGRQEEPRQV